ncbi:MAG: hypothetical protein CMJ83_19040 [Planctomycetes bacterium]|nr:hypothetical protein [Planctomycetota bacterium]
MRRESERGGSLTAVLLAAIIVWLLFLCVDFVKDRVVRSGRFRVSASRITLDASPGRLSPPLASILRSGPAPLDHERSILDPQVPDMVRERLEKRPWIRRVRSVRREFPDRLRVRVELRTPLAVVCAGRERLLIDDEAVVIASDTRLKPPRLPYVRTPGAPLRLVPRDGRTFPATSAVREALSVLRAIRDLGAHAALDTLRIDEVIVGWPDRRRRSGASDVRLVCDTGLEILWGRAPDSQLGLVEHPPATKLDLLQRVQRKHPGLVGIKLVDLRFLEPEFERAH